MQTSEGNPLRALLAAAGIDADEHVGRSDDWPQYGPPPEATHVGHQVWWCAPYTVTMPSEIGHWFYRMGGRVQAEIVHAHHPLVAHLSLWRDLPWAERQKQPVEPVIEALWLGPLAGEGIHARVRATDYGGVELVWLAPAPEQLRALVRAVEGQGMRLRLELHEALGAEVDLDAVW